MIEENYAIIKSVFHVLFLDTFKVFAWEIE